MEHVFQSGQISHSHTLIAISHGEAESLGLSLSHRRQVGGLSVFYRLLSGLATLCFVCDLSPPYFCRVLKVRQQPPSGKTTKITNQCSPSLFHSSFSPPLKLTPSLCSIPFFPPGLQNSCLPPPLIFPHPKPRYFLPPLIHLTPTSFKFPAFLPESSLSCKDLNVPIVSILFLPCTPPHPFPFHRSPNVSVPHCFVLPSPSPLLSCPPRCALCVSSHTGLGNVYQKKKKRSG